MKIVYWLDQRTGCKKIARDALYENVPGGARWRYVWGSTLVFTLFIQFITGLFLWMGYAPSATSAWESVNYIQHEMQGGWLLRGLHHFTAHAMTVLLVLHLMQVVIDGAYKAPREINFWFGILLLLLVLALSLTGYLLPWDQKGYWATKVTTSLISQVPLVGPQLQRIIVGGADYGHHTLTRFFALHAGVIPAAIVILLVGHIYLFRRHGLTPKQPLRRRDQPFWPEQVLKDSVACLAVLATVLFLIILPRLLNPDAPLGASLGAPADPADSYSAARPEWYFLFLFQFLKYFPGEAEVWGAIGVPSVVIAFIFLMPFLGQWKLGHRFNVAVLFGLLGGAVMLTYLAVAEDRANPVYQAAVRVAEEQSRRVRALAQAPTGIPREGALHLLKTDPLTQGPMLFAKHCASCHRYDGHNGLGLQVEDPQTAADLKGFASREWIAGLLDPNKIKTPHYFGGTKFESGKMVRYVTRDVAEFSPEERAQLQKVIMALSAEANLPTQQVMDAQDAALIAEGRTLAREEIACTDCHQFRQLDETASAPDLTGYGSRQWLIDFIADPTVERFYGRKNDRMPAFGKQAILTETEIGLIADWIREDWYRPPQTAPAR